MQQQSSSSSPGRPQQISLRLCRSTVPGPLREDLVSSLAMIMSACGCGWFVVVVSELGLEVAWSAVSTWWAAVEGIV